MIPTIWYFEKGKTIPEKITLAVVQGREVNRAKSTRDL